MLVADFGGAAVALCGDVGAVNTGAMLPFQHAEGFFGPGVAVDGPVAGAGTAAYGFKFAAAAFAFEQAGVAEIDEEVIVAVD